VRDASSVQAGPQAPRQHHPEERLGHHGAGLGHGAAGAAAQGPPPGARPVGQPEPGGLLVEPRQLPEVPVRDGQLGGRENRPESAQHGRDGRAGEHRRQGVGEQRQPSAGAPHALLVHRAERAEHAGAQPGRRGAPRGRGPQTHVAASQDEQRLPAGATGKCSNHRLSLH